MDTISKKEIINATPKKILALEERLQKELGFKRKWLDDNSGYWLEKKYDFIGSNIFLSFDPDSGKEPVYIYLRSKEKEIGTYFSYLDLVEMSPKKLSFNGVKKIDNKLAKISKIKL